MKKINKMRRIVILCFVCVLFAFDVNASENILEIKVGQIARIKEVPSDAIWDVENKNVVSIIDGKIKAEGVGLSQVRAQTLEGKEWEYQIGVILPSKQLLFSDRKKLYNEIIKNINDNKKKFHFAVRIESKKDEYDSEKKDKQKIIKVFEKFLPAPKELRIAYCDGYTYNYAITRKDENVVFIETTLTFHYSAEAALSQFYEGKKKILTKKEIRLKNKCDAIIKKLNLRNMNKRYQKVLAVHDYIVKNTQFDLAATQEEDWQNNLDSYNAYGALIAGKATCKGYAQAMKLLLEAVDIPCDYVVGEKITLHAWNRVQLDDDQWYNIDISGNDPLPDKKGRVLYTYFNLTDKQLEKTHTWIDQTHKAISKTYSYDNIQKMMRKEKSK